MRTVIIIAIGLLIGLVAVYLSRPAARRVGASVFALTWLLVTAFNLRTGLSHGYALQEELPIHLLIFFVPVLAAWWLARRRRGPQ